jgi:hypothetical protein
MEKQAVVVKKGLAHELVLRTKSDLKEARLRSSDVYRNEDFITDLKPKFRL